LWSHLYFLPKNRTYIVDWLEMSSHPIFRRNTPLKDNRLWNPRSHECLNFLIDFWIIGKLKFKMCFMKFYFWYVYCCWHDIYISMWCDLSRVILLLMWQPCGFFYYKKTCSLLNCQFFIISICIFNPSKKV